MISKIKGFIKKVFSDTKKTIIAIVVILVVVVLASGAVSSNKEKDLRQQALDDAKKRSEEAAVLVDDTSESSTNEDAYLMTIQDSLVQSYGPLPDGYLWETDGSLLSLGDKDMSAEDVVYAYLNGIRSLDLSMAQKYSRRSSVVSQYENYFNSGNVSQNYSDSFMRNMYKEVMLSIQPKSIIDTSVFAENKQVFTIELNVLDLSSKDFWLQDKDEIYRNLYIYSTSESDSTKSETYLYDYVLNYYRSNEAVTRDVVINLTVERFPDLDTGWLVSIDTDLSDICNYKDGNIVINYIQNQYQKEGIDAVKQSLEEEEEKNKDTESEDKKSEEITTEGTNGSVEG